MRAETQKNLAACGSPWPLNNVTRDGAAVMGKPRFSFFGGAFWGYEL